MAHPDLNLLVALDILLTEGNVARAARRLRLSPSAMSRTLARLRETTGDPLLVRAGRGLVPTPRAQVLHDQAGPLVEAATALLRPADRLDLATLTRTFTLRSSEGFAETFGPVLMARMSAEAPGVRLRFAAKPDKDGGPLRTGAVDLETGVVGTDSSPELRTQALFRDRFVAVVSAGHPLANGNMTPARFAAGRHVVASRRGRESGPIDDELARLGLRREVAALVDGFATALALARSSDLIATVPERHTAALRTGMATFPVPVPVAEIAIAMQWHPRMDADPAHRWLRQCVREVCAA